MYIYIYKRIHFDIKPDNNKHCIHTDNSSNLSALLAFQWNYVMNNKSSSSSEELLFSTVNDWSNLEISSVGQLNKVCYSAVSTLFLALVMS